ncbi:MAG: FHA domain-containing protein [Magnetococcales bacterium]|nr:FHA domain-containing protein [Magnetococcales bacterium]
MADGVHAKLILLEHGVLIREYLMEKEIMTIGRISSCEIRLAYPPISRTHARIERLDSDHYRLRDLNSKNGTLVNSTRVQEHRLRHGDRILLGKYTVIFWCPRESKP